MSIVFFSLGQFHRGHVTVCRTLAQEGDLRVPGRGGHRGGLYLLYFIVTRPVAAEVAGSHIVYVSPHFYLMPVMVFYLAATCVSCFFSSHGFVRLFGALALLSFIAAYLIHVMALVSIWCFFAAILSLLIYLHLRFRTLGGFQEEPVLSPAIVRSGESHAHR